MVDRAIIRIDQVRVPPGRAYNILSYSDDFVMQNDPRFVPNTYAGVAMKFDHEWHDITIVFDSDVDIFNTYIIEGGPNLPIPSFIVDFTVVIVATQAVVAERWTYTPHQIYVRDRRMGEVEEGRERQTFEYRLIAYGDRTITYP